MKKKHVESKAKEEQEHVELVAAALGMSIKQVRAHLEQIRQTMAEQYKGTGTEVTGVTYDLKTKQVKVTIKPAKIVVPKSLTPEQRRAVALAENAQVGQMRMRTALFELGLVFGEPRTALPMLMASAVKSGTMIVHKPRALGPSTVEIAKESQG